jgi:microcystin-dependent protein
MARVEIPFSVTNSSGGPVSGASAQVNVRNSTPATVYAAETGATTLPNPLSTDSLGRIEGWVDEGSYDVTVSGATITTYTQKFEAVRGDGVGLVAPNAIGASQVQNGALTFAKLAADVVPSIFPAGMIIAFGGSVVPGGFVLCNGATYDGTNATYTRLYSAIGTTWGGTGQSAFKVPDLRSRALMGAGQGTGLTNRTLAQLLGEELHILTVAEHAPHAHGGKTAAGTTGAGSTAATSTVAAYSGAADRSLDHLHATSVGGAGFSGWYAGSAGGNPGFASGMDRSIDHLHLIPALTVNPATVNPLSVPQLTITTEGGGTGHNTIHPSAVVNFIIKL